ncbi:hypothetical protein Asal01_01022 [Fodinibius salicampi]
MMDSFQGFFITDNMIVIIALPYLLTGVVLFFINPGGYCRFIAPYNGPQCFERGTESGLMVMGV